MKGVGEWDRPVALVTGGGGDIGRAIALRLAPNCSAVAIVDIDEGAATQTAHLVEAAGCKAMAIRADVSNPQQSAAFVDAVEFGFGPIGIFANNAGIEGVVAPLHEYPDDVFDRLLQVNVKGVFLGLKFVMARMIARGRGAIVNTASTSAIRAARRAVGICRLEARGGRPDADGGAGSGGDARQGQRGPAGTGRVADDPRAG